MSLARKDIKVYFAPEVHAALTAIAKSKRMGLGEYVESLVVPHVNCLVDEVIGLHGEFLRSGIVRERRVNPGKARNPNHE
jgi:hypothetical protein